MDLSEYMPMFLAEAREHLQGLNLAIVALEESAGDRGTVDEIFRIAHSIKGMSATMGFEQVAALTHEMEEVLELLRHRNDGLPREAVDTVLACLDALSDALDSIESTGQEALDPTPLAERLRALVRSHDFEAEPPPAERAASPALVPVPDSDGSHVVHVRIALAADVLMPGVRAHMVLAALGDHGTLLRSEPMPEAVEAFAGREVEAWLLTPHEPEHVAATARSVSDVAAVEVTAGEPAPAPDLDGHPDREVPDSDLTSTATGARTVRVDAERLDLLMHSMGELVIHRTAVQALTEGLDVPGLQQAVADLARSSQQLQSMVMHVRMIPVEAVFLRFPRLVRDLGNKLGKEVVLNLVGKDTELDRTVVELLGDPLVHLVRNALDHGLEPPQARTAAGKPAAGTLEISARHAGSSVVIEVRDDGRGVDPAAVARRAVASGLIDAETAAELDMRGAIELLFAPGFSTASRVSDISGRGVGMDVVRSKIRELGGEVTLESTPGLGTLAQIRLPLTLAIVQALQVEVAGAPFAIPLDRVERTLRLTPELVRSAAGHRVLMLDDGVLPLLDGGTALAQAPVTEHGLVVIVRGEDRRLAVAVDELVGQCELVTRPLPAVVSSGQPLSGGAVLADGRIALIVDCDALAAPFASSTVMNKPVRLAA